MSSKLPPENELIESILSMNEKKLNKELIKNLLTTVKII